MIPMNDISYSFSDITDKNKKDIWILVVKADKEFIPNLSSRNDTTQTELNISKDVVSLPVSYYEKLISQKFIIATFNDAVVGFMAYIPDYSLRIDEKQIICLYISTIIVDPDFRRRGITRTFYNILKENYPDTYIVTRTWSSNYSHIQLLESIGFNMIKVIKDDRGTGIDTLYYSFQS